MASETHDTIDSYQRVELIDIGLQSNNYKRLQRLTISLEELHVYKDIGKLIERCITPKLDDESLILRRETRSRKWSMTIYLPMFTKTRASNTHREGETRRPYRARYI